MTVYSDSLITIELDTLLFLEEVVFQGTMPSTSMERESVECVGLLGKMHG